MSDYYKLQDKVIERAKELYDESKKDESLDNLERLANKCVDEAIRELIVNEDNKWIIIKWACTGTNELLYEGNFMCRFSAPYDDFYNVCLNDLMDRLI